MRFLQFNNAQNSPNRNFEVEELQVRYEALRNQFKTLQTALKQRHDSLVNEAKARVSVCGHPSLNSRVSLGVVVTLLNLRELSSDALLLHHSLHYTLL